MHCDEGLLKPGTPAEPPAPDRTTFRVDLYTPLIAMAGESSGATNHGLVVGVEVYTLSGFCRRSRRCGHRHGMASVRATSGTLAGSRVNSAPPSSVYRTRSGATWVRTPVPVQSCG